MSESRDRLNTALREAGFNVRGDLVVTRTARSETRQVRTGHEVVVAVSTEISIAFDPDGACIKRFLKSSYVLWNHDYEGLPIGRAYFSFAGSAIEIRPTLSAKLNFHCDTELSREVWVLIKDAAGVEWELGVIPAEWVFSPDEDILVTKWDVVEISAVPSEECVEEIHRRIMKRTISSPAMLRSVEEVKVEPEPETADRGEMSAAKANGPYSWQSKGAGPENWFIITGPGVVMQVDQLIKAECWVVQLNDAWRRGRESAREESPPDHPSDCLAEPAVAAPYRWEYEAFAGIGKGPRCIVSGPGVEEYVESDVDAKRWTATLDRVLAIERQRSHTNEYTPNNLPERVAELERWRVAEAEKLTRVRKEWERDIDSDRKWGDGPEEGEDGG